jgi:hypothetical protein
LRRRHRGAGARGRAERRLLARLEGERRQQLVELAELLASDPFALSGAGRHRG